MGQNQLTHYIALCVLSSISIYIGILFIIYLLNQDFFNSKTKEIYENISN